MSYGGTRKREKMKRNERMAEKKREREREKLL
jgi:hypothetical protein